MRNRRVRCAATATRSPQPRARGFADHADYRFHISLAYRLIELSDEETARYQQMLNEIDARFNQQFGLLDLPAPQLTFFDDMTRFVPGEQRGRLASRQAKL